MSPAHLHLLLNHVPIIGSFFAAALLAAGLARRSRDLARAGLAALVVAAVLTLPTMLTGEPAEELVERLPGVTRGVVHAHEEAAELASWLMYATGLAALAALALDRRGRAPRWANPAVLALGAVAFGLMARVGYLGGQVRHTEIRADAAAPAPAGDEAGLRRGRGAGVSARRTGP